MTRENKEWAAIGALASVAGVLVTLWIYLDQKESDAAEVNQTLPGHGVEAEAEPPVFETESEPYVFDTGEDRTGPSLTKEHSDLILVLGPTVIDSQTCYPTGVDWDAGPNSEGTIETFVASGYHPAADVVMDHCTPYEYAMFTLANGSTSWFGSSASIIDAERCWELATEGHFDLDQFIVDPQDPAGVGFEPGMVWCTTTSQPDRLVRAELLEVVDADGFMLLGFGVNTWVWR
ncbi:hypothetical protein [Natronoglycomyces albus]|uniref:Uncharacterized protein n=1 Tax=Natronoglycomyces albus TaxID=2811108 RepID=A0A895XMZ5_9ACTN|nr:hypothetical protein [Natronoglycomyces albus]QSB03846.1 hypothetical protein JQS30_08380 [Natronoglycomyces albus]